MLIQIGPMERKTVAMFAHEATDLLGGDAVLVTEPQQRIQRRLSQQALQVSAVSFGDLFALQRIGERLRVDPV